MKTIFPRLIALVSAVALALSLIGCGNKGPLVPPKAALHAVTALKFFA